MPFGSPRRQWQHWVEPIQSLNRRLFIHTKHSCMLRRMQVQTDDVSRFVFKIRIVIGHIPFQSMRFQLRLRQNPLHRGLAEAQLTRQFPAGPVRAAVLSGPCTLGLSKNASGSSLHAPGGVKTLAASYVSKTAD